MKFSIEFEREVDGRWIAEIPQLPGVMVYGSTKKEARERVEALALQQVASRNVTGGSQAASESV